MCCDVVSLSTVVLSILYRKTRRQLVPQVRYGTPEERFVILRLESTDDWRKVTNVGE